MNIATSVLPAGWRDPLVDFERIDAEPSTAACLEAHDLVIAKLVARRPKDVSFATALIREDVVDVDTLLQRAALIDGPEAVRQRLRGLILRCAGDGGYSARSDGRRT